MARRRAATLALVGALTLAACGGGGDADETDTGAPAPDPTVTTGASDGDRPADGSTTSTTTIDDQPVAEFLPEIEVVDVASGDTIDLRALADPSQPTLLWFWAPHCTFCMREAPEVVALAAEHGDDLRIIGLGAQDSLEEAEGFLDSTGTGDLDMVWDATGETWIHFGVTNQPTVVVLSPEGEIRQTWFRDFDEDGILAAAGLS